MVADILLMKYALLAMLLVITVSSDIKHYRVYNLHVYIGMASGLLLGFIHGGFEVFLQSLWGMLIPMITLMILFALRMLGAGDIKLFCAVGSIMGIEFIIPAMLWSFISGGIIALVIMTVKGNIRSRFLHIASYLKALCISPSFIPYTDFRDKNDGSKFHFTLAIAAGCIIQTLSKL